jgi:hypothetical protein
MKRLTISHHIYLTKEQSYSLYEGTEIKVVGVSIPIWIIENKTTEPPIEVFAKYTLINQNKGISVKYNEEGYEITIPKNHISKGKLLPDDIFNSLSEEDQFKYQEPRLCIANLLDVKDIGSEWLAFRQFSNIQVEDKLVDLVHYVEIKRMNDLLETLC